MNKLKGTETVSTRKEKILELALEELQYRSSEISNLGFSISNPYKDSERFDKLDSIEEETDGEYDSYSKYTVTYFKGTNKEGSHISFSVKQPLSELIGLGVIG